MRLGGPYSQSGGIFMMRKSLALTGIKPQTIWWITILMTLSEPLKIDSYSNAITDANEGTMVN
jgi:hypothetical protein